MERKENQVLAEEPRLDSRWSIRGMRSAIRKGLAIVSSMPAMMASFVCSGLAFALMAMIGSLLQIRSLSSVSRLQLLVSELKLRPLDSLGPDLRLPLTSLLLRLVRFSHSLIILAAVRPSMTGIQTSIKIQSIWTS
jgi:hypothetical protein